MIEVIDETTNQKLMALIISSFKYGNELYCLYSIKRDEENDNIFVSKLIKNSLGYTMDNNFEGGEKEALDEAITSILNKDNLNSLKEIGLELTKVELTTINKFNKDACYVTTYKRDLLKECMLNYNLISPTTKKTVIKLKKEKTFTKDKISTILLIIFGIIIIITCLTIVFTILF